MTEPAPYENAADVEPRELAPVEDAAEPVELAPLVEGTPAAEQLDSPTGDGADAGNVPGSDAPDAHTPLGEPEQPGDGPALDRLGDRSAETGANGPAGAPNSPPAGEPVDGAAGESAAPSTGTGE